ncbi:MAG: hypothetical protein ACYCXB_06410 [Candidatus Humimicrobiaceae bacterium]
MADIDKLKKASYMSKRMYILKEGCELLGLSLEYLFGLFNYYNNQNKGKWFWQKAAFTGPIKAAYENFNKSIDKFIKELKNADESFYSENVKNLSVELEDLIKKMEINLNVNRETDISMVQNYMDNNIRNLINDALKGLL